MRRRSRRGREADGQYWRTGGTVSMPGGT